MTGRSAIEENSIFSFEVNSIAKLIQLTFFQMS